VTADLQPELPGSLIDPPVASCPWDFQQQPHARCPVYRQPGTGMWPYVEVGGEATARGLFDNLMAGACR
jgi:hypothetical protein